MFRRLKHESEKTLYDIIHEVVVTLNHSRNSSATNMLPREALTPENVIR